MPCNYCHSEEAINSLQQELNKKNEQLKRLELDLQTLNQKFVAQIEHVSNVQHEKDLVEHELEELSLRLFEEANAMVAIEKKARWQSENELKQTQEQLLAEQTQLSELRQKLLATEHQTEALKDPVLSRKKMNCNSSNDPNLRAQLDLEELYGLKRANSTKYIISYQSNNDEQQKQQQRTTSMPPTPSTSNHTSKKKRTTSSSIDGIQLEAFREYTALASSTQQLSTKKLIQTHYMKHCLAEDIEPCLRFGPQSKLSVKKMIDYLSRQPCFIECVANPIMSTVKDIPQQQQQQQYIPIWERFSSSASVNSKKSIIITNACSACGRHADPEERNHQSVKLNYQFRLDEQGHWLLIDQYCRDRLVAVCEFFVFIRNIQMGLYADRSIEDLYIENIRLRLQMFYSRMGTLPVVMKDLGLKPDKVGKASQPTLINENNDAYLSDGSISTGPNTPEQNVLLSPSPIHSAWTLESSSEAK
ncbi:MAG: hypothetical protein EXX96DRAFT_557939 [Benjaminiella poitrasii]|nr:MAG: hypothetical protein EXX96DRAFT_557939 [Benjaminiella poitrasii]